MLQNATTGALIFTDDLGSPIVLASTLAGTGKSDVVLALDAAGIAAYDSAVALSGLTAANIRVGLYANASDAAGGVESFYVVNQAATGVPEPTTGALVGAGLLAAGLPRRRQR